MGDLAELYRDLHAHPELAFQETRTAAVVAEHLQAAGFDVTERVGGTGVVGVLTSGDGPRVLLRADMDALAVAEETGLPYASSQRASTDDGRDVPVMHACGHDMHITCLIGAARALAATRQNWQGTLVVLFQPAEELGRGAQAMLDDGLYERFGRPDVVLGQHVVPIPAGILALRPGVAFAASDSLRVVLYGRGGHGSRPEAAVDPIVMAAAVVQRLQSVVSREVAATDTAVVTVGSLHAGTAANIIPETAELQLTVRTVDGTVRDRVLPAVRRIIRAEAAASGAPADPEITGVGSFPAVANDPEACARVTPALAAVTAPWPVVDPGLVTGSEDVGLLAEAAAAPCVYWLLGGADPAHFDGAASVEDIRRIVDTLPTNHSPRFAPVLSPTIERGVAALVAAAREWLGGGVPPSG